jgi:hypothetical protein
MAVTAGAYKLSSVAKLPNASVAFPGEHWSDIVANGTVVPGEAVVISTVSGRKVATRATAAQATSHLRRIGIALRPVGIPDVNMGPGALGPNELVNQAITSGEYVHVYYSGGFNLTLVVPSDAYVPGDLITWDDTAARPVGKGGTGAWTRVGATEANAFFEVIKPYRNVNPSDTDEGILTVRSLRGQF